VTGGVFYDLGERDTAAECFLASLAAARQIGHQAQAARATGNLGCIHADQGDCEKASAFFHESLLEDRKNGNRRGMGVMHSFLGLVAQERGNGGLARLHYRRGLDLLEQVGDHHRRAYVEGLYAWFLLETTELDAAEALLVGIVDRFVARLDWRLRAMFLATLAFIRALAGKGKGCRRLLTEAGRLAPAQSDASADGVLAVFRAGSETLLAKSTTARERVRKRAAAELAAVSAPRSPDEQHPDGRPALTDISSEVRTALRILAANGVEVDLPET